MSKKQPNTTRYTPKEIKVLVLKKRNKNLMTRKETTKDTMQATAKMPNCMPLKILPCLTKEMVLIREPPTIAVMER